MYFQYVIILFTLALASKGILTPSPGPGPGSQADCAKEQFKCANAECILEMDRCDGHYHCVDQSDEMNCLSCNKNAFSCGDGKCIAQGDVCDLSDDCEDGSDENNCTNRVCGSDTFRCESGQCVDKRWRCDGFSECADHSDEENCLECSGSSGELSGNLFKCVSNNNCIYRHQLCNSIKNCPDGSDEDATTCQNLECAEGEIQCAAGHCVPFHEDHICKGNDFCGGNFKTEKPKCKECPPYMFKCEIENKCIQNEKLCDTMPDCEDESDESEITCQLLKCEPGAFQCQNGQCVGYKYDHTKVCNGHYDCHDESDKSDEANCTMCSPHAIKCGSGECVHKYKLCNSIAECSDGSDENEINCPYKSTPPVLPPFWIHRRRTHIPTNVTLQHLTKDLAVYFDSSISPSVIWPFAPLLQAWKYAKETFGTGTFSAHESPFLYVVLGKSKYDNEYKVSSRSWESGYRNIIDLGLGEKDGWVTENSGNFEKLVSSLGYIVKMREEGFENIADYDLCEYGMQDFIFYDIYIHLKGQGSADVMRWRANQFNQTFEWSNNNCFRDWFLPIYETYGGSTVLKNYFQIFKLNWPTKKGVYSKFNFYEQPKLNVGELVHFWSGAAKKDLRYLAKSTFDKWDHVFMKQFAKAQIDFPNIKYQGEEACIVSVLIGIVICVLSLIIIVLVSKASLPHIRKKYTLLVEQYS